MYPEEENNFSSAPNISSNTTSQFSYTTLSNNPGITAHERKLFTNKLLQKRVYKHGLSFNMSAVLEEESIERKSFEEEWDSVIASAVELVGHPTSEYSLDALLVGERPAVVKEMKKLVAAKHPLIETFNAYKSGGLDSSNFPALMTLLIGKAVAPPTDALQHSDILHSQRELAEIIEMLHFSHTLHKKMMEFPKTNKAEPAVKQEIFETENLSVDETNVQKQILAAIVSSSAENPIETTEKLNLTSIPTYSKEETHSRVGSVLATTGNSNLTSMPSEKSYFSKNEQKDYQAPTTESKTHLSATRIFLTENQIKIDNSETNQTENTTNVSGTSTNSVENPTQLTGSIKNLTENPINLSAETTYLTDNEFEANTAETKPTETTTNGISFSNLVTDNLESEETSDVSKNAIYETSNKISILCGDYFIAHSLVAAAKLRSAKVFELITQAMRNYTASSFVCAPEVTDSEGGLKLWTTRNTMNLGSLLSQGLQSTLVLAGHTDQDLMVLVKFLGIHIALACQAKQELKPFLDNGKATNHIRTNIDDTSRMNGSHLEKRQRDKDVDDRASTNAPQIRPMSLPVLLHMDHTKDWDLWHDLANPQEHPQELMQQIADAEVGIVGSWQVLQHHRQEAEMLLQKIPHNEAQTILQAILQTLACRPL